MHVCIGCATARACGLCQILCVSFSILQWQPPSSTHITLSRSKCIHTHATAFAHIPGGVRWRHELVVGPARREQVEGNVVRNSRLEECNDQLHF